MRRIVRSVVAVALGVVALAVVGTVSAAPAAAAPLEWTQGDSYATSRSSRLCLDIADASSARGARAVQYTCHRGPNQLFQMSYGVPVNGGAPAFAIRMKHSGMCLEVRGASHDNGAPIQQWPCTGNENQLWYWESLIRESGRTWLRNAESGKCIDVPHDSRDASVYLAQYTCREGDRSFDNQIWDLRPR